MVHSFNRFCCKNNAFARHLTVPLQIGAARETTLGVMGGFLNWDDAVLPTFRVLVPTLLQVHEKTPALRPGFSFSFSVVNSVPAEEP